MFDSNHHIGQKLGIVTTMKHRINTLITTEEDKNEEEQKMKSALRECGYPEWALQRTSKTNADKPADESRGKVVIPYIKTISEKIAKVYKQYNVQTIHKPAMKLKSYICNMKDKVHQLDRVGAIYEARCEKHNVIYVGETGRSLKERAYEHRIVSHKQSVENQSIKNEEKEIINNVQNTRRSKRNVKRKDYKKIHTGANIHLTEGSTEVSKHVALQDHEQEDLAIKALAYDENWYTRGIREAMEIKKRRPEMNIDEGRYHLSVIYDNILRSPPDVKIQRRNLEEIPTSNV